MYELSVALFYHDRKWVKKKKLSDHLGLSKKTIETYLDIIEKLFEGLLEIDRTSKLIRANFSLSIGIKTIKKIFIRNSLIAKIIGYSFFHKIENKADLAARLGTSDSSIYRNIKSFNKSIRGVYDIKFSYAELDFEGDEFDIQKFLLNLFINTQTDPNYWPFEKEVSFRDATKIAYIIGSYINIDIGLGQYSFIKTALAISIIRYKRGHRVKSESYDEEIIGYIKEAVKKPEVSFFFKKQFPSFDGDLVHLIYDVLAFFFENEYIPLFNDLDEIFLKVPDYEDYVAYLSGKVRYLCDKYGIDKSRLDEIYRSIFSYFSVKLFNIDQADFFVDKSEYFLDYIKIINIDFYRDMIEIMEDFLEKFPALKKRYSPETLTYAVYSTWPGLIGHLIKIAEPKKGIIISNYDGSYAILLQDFINSSISKFLLADIYDKPFLDIGWLEKSDYDVIIVDFLLKEPIKDKLVINLENLPMTNRASKILEKIARERYKKIRSENEDLF